MRPQTTISMGLMLAVGILAQAVKAEDKPEKDPLDGLKCFIMKKKDVKGKKVMDYKEGKLYLCCSSCVKRVEKYPEKYEAMANHQLVYTKQYKQTVCPVTGKKVNQESPKLKIDGVEVMFVDLANLQKIKELELEKQIEMVFGKKGFKMGEFKFIKKQDAEKEASQTKTGH